VIRTKTDVWARTSRPARIGAFVRALPELPVVLRRIRPDLLHVNNGGYPGAELCRVATVVAHFAGAPKCVLSVHSPPWPREVSQPQIQAIADRLVWRSVDAVHAATVFVERRLAELRGMPPALCRKIPYGVTEPLGTSDEITALKARLVPGTGVLVGMISATGEAEKGHAVFAEALARADPDIHAVIVGSHPGDALTEQLSRIGLAGRVALVGRVPPAEFGAYLLAIDLLVVPSTAYESLPLVVLEAMAAGKPVFASRLSGIPEAVVDGETGRLFEPGAVAELAALLDEAGRAPDELRRMGEAGHERWGATFSTGAMTASMLELYERLAGS
jgi:L-malate glycosyltransferase